MYILYFVYVLENTAQLVLLFMCTMADRGSRVGRRTSREIYKTWMKHIVLF